MLTDDERKTLIEAAEQLESSIVDEDADLAVAAKLRAIAAPRTAPSPTPDACAAIERAATWIELGELGGTPDAVALVATLREFVRKPRVATVGEVPRPQCPTHGDTVNCYCTTGALHCHDCGHTPPFCTTCDDYHDAATGCASTRGPIGEG